MNISSLPAHIDDLKTFLKPLNINLHIICNSESRLNTKTSLITNINILDYDSEQTPTRSTAGSTLMYFPKTFVYIKKRTKHIQS